MHVDFQKIKHILRNPNSSNNDAEDSSIYSQLAYTLTNVIDETKNMTEKELAMFIISLQYWTIRRRFSKCKVSVKVGDVFLADLGISYRSESAYEHPVIILEEIGNLLLVVPTSSSSSKVSQAYHPVDNPNGKNYWRKVTSLDGFDRDSAVLLGNMTTINPGRLLKKLCSLDNSLYREIKEKVFEIGFPKLNITILKLIDSCHEFKADNKKLKEENTRLKEEIESLRE